MPGGLQLLTNRYVSEVQNVVDAEGHRPYPACPSTKTLCAPKLHQLCMLKYALGLLCLRFCKNAPPCSSTSPLLLTPHAPPHCPSPIPGICPLYPASAHTWHLPTPGICPYLASAHTWVGPPGAACPPRQVRCPCAPSSLVASPPQTQQSGPAAPRHTRPSAASPSPAHASCGGKQLLNADLTPVPRILAPATLPPCNLQPVACFRFLSCARIFRSARVGELRKISPRDPCARALQSCPCITSALRFVASFRFVCTNASSRGQQASTHSSNTP